MSSKDTDYIVYFNNNNNINIQFFDNNNRRIHNNIQMIFINNMNDYITTENIDSLNEIINHKNILFNLISCSKDNDYDLYKQSNFSLVNIFDSNYNYNNMLTFRHINTNIIYDSMITNIIFKSLDIIYKNWITNISYTEALLFHILFIILSRINRLELFMTNHINIFIK